MNEYWRTVFGWSKSRQDIWNTCKLQYYYTYIGKWEGWKDDLTRRKLQWLGKKTKWDFVKGQLAHEAIESQINQWAIGRDVSKEGAKNLFNLRLRKIQESPRDFLIEEMNGDPIPSEKYDEVRKDGSELLDSFFDIIWKNYEIHKYVKHEDFDSFQIGDVKVWVKVDLVTKLKTGETIVTDWKTGNPPDRETEDRQQVLGYILWAMKKFGLDAAQVRAELCYLRVPGDRPRIVSATMNQLKEFEDYVTTNAKVMLDVKFESDFLPNPLDKECQRCAFATVCPDGSSFIPKEARDTPIPPNWIGRPTND